MAPFGGIFENSTFSESLSFVSILDEFEGVTVSFLLLEKKAKAFYYRIELKKNWMSPITFHTIVLFVRLPKKPLRVAFRSERVKRA